MKDFAWQEGYGAFTIGVSQIDETIKYIINQEDHHRKKTFREEFIDFLSGVCCTYTATEVAAYYQ